MSTKCRLSKLTIPNDALHAAAAGKYITEIAKKIGFDSGKIQAIEIGVTDAIMAIVDYSFEPGEQANLEVSCELIPTGLRITLKDKGLPFGETLPNSNERAATTEATPIFGQRVNQLQNYMDEVSLHNRGHQGKEIVLIKHLSSKTITDYYEECELEPYGMPRPDRETDAQASKWIVRQMKASEAVEVSKAVYKAYGYSYAREYMYFPEKIIALNESGQMQSAVAVTGDNRIAGHCALQYWEENPRIAELSAGVVKPQFRSRGYFAGLTDYLIKKAQEKDLLGVFIHTVTNHTISQKTGHRAGLQDCAIRLGLVPTTMSFKGFSDNLHQKLSIIIQFRYMSIPPPPVLYLPVSHRSIVAEIYENLGVFPKFSETSGTPKPNTQSEFKIQVVPSLNFARITMGGYGSDAVTKIKSELKELCYKKIEAVNLYLNLFDPLTADMTEEFEALGFFFAGVMPGGLAAGDALILQYLNNVPIDYGQINISSDIAQRILAHIKNIDPNTE